MQNKLANLFKSFKHIGITLFVAYISICACIYTFQKKMLFPAFNTKPVTEKWKPSVGDSQTQAMIQGHCGQLHVVKWDIHHAKGTMMMFHGNGESVASINDYAHAFHNLGYNLMTWDYPSYGRSTDCWFSEEDLLSDAESSYQWLASQEKPEKIFIFGYSIGTGIALSVASKHPDNPVFLVAPYDSLSNVANDAMPPFLPVRFLIRYPMSTQVWVNQIKQPIYAIHGDQDTLIKPSRAMSLAQNSHGKIKIEWVKGAGHVDDKLFFYRNQWLKKLLPE